MKTYKCKNDSKVESVIDKMESRKHIENFLECLESDLCPDICVWGHNVDKLVLSASPPDSAQMWRLMQIIRIQLLDLKETLAKKEEKEEEQKPAPIIKRHRKKETKKKENAEDVTPKKRQKKMVAKDASLALITGKESVN